MSRMKKEDAGAEVGVELLDDEFSLWYLLITASIVVHRLQTDHNEELVANVCESLMPGRKEGRRGMRVRSCVENVSVARLANRTVWEELQPNPAPVYWLEGKIGSGTARIPVTLLLLLICSENDGSKGFPLLMNDVSEQTNSKKERRILNLRDLSDELITGFGLLLYLIPFSGLLAYNRLMSRLLSLITSRGIEILRLFFTTRRDHILVVRRIE